MVISAFHISNLLAKAPAGFFLIQDVRFKTSEFPMDIFFLTVKNERNGLIKENDYF